MLPLTQQPSPSPAVYRARRQRIAERIGEGAALILHGGQSRIRSNDTEHRFRPDSNFHYLSGLSEPGAVLVVRPGRDPEFALFVRPRDPQAEIWSGRRIGPEQARAVYGADAAWPIGELAAQLPRLLDGCATVHLPFAAYEALDRQVFAAIDHLRRRNRYGDVAPERLEDARALLGEDRIIKDAGALGSLRRAVDISARGHLAALRACRPGLYEHELEALLEYHFRRLGSSGPGYGSIVGTGDNATILHYVDNCCRLEEGHLVLIDAGAEWDYFTGDITRTFPVSGRFTPAQRDLYAIVLAANEAGIREAQVGSTVDSIYHVCLRTLCQGLRDLGLVDGDLDGILEDEARYIGYTRHRHSHWLGADVHDAGHYCFHREPRPLQPGMVLTIEPGLYIAADDERAPAELRGTGIRIEDDVLIQAAGPEVLTHLVPKGIDELEAIVGSEA
ncbi:MAG: aminopeptidase P N-terminal domain-containing protein [Myxococcales bacterium]|nr:aminopeptidase P N-terminal domain-containing protein [Myxococcales bacterium]MCB9701660.1 aminopeptidase P N-terminal domain-containing protein [Myxococcales bacterium]